MFLFSMSASSTVGVPNVRLPSWQSPWAHYLRALPTSAALHPLEGPWPTDLLQLLGFRKKSTVLPSNGGDSMDRKGWFV